MDLVTTAAAVLPLLPAVDAPVDLSAATTTILTVMGGLGAALLAVLAGALGIKGIRWGVPKVVQFFTRNV